MRRSGVNDLIVESAGTTLMNWHTNVLSRNDDFVSFGFVVGDSCGAITYIVLVPAHW